MRAGKGPASGRPAERPRLPRSRKAASWSHGRFFGDLRTFPSSIGHQTRPVAHFTCAPDLKRRKSPLGVLASSQKPPTSSRICFARLRTCSSHSRSLFGRAAATVTGQPQPAPSAARPPAFPSAAARTCVRLFSGPRTARTAAAALQLETANEELGICCSPVGRLPDQPTDRPTGVPAAWPLPYVRPSVRPRARPPMGLS